MRLVDRREGGPVGVDVGDDEDSHRYWLAGSRSGEFRSSGEPTSPASSISRTATVDRRLRGRRPSASQWSYQSWNIRRVQSGLRWSRTPARCSPIRRATSSGRNSPCRSSRSRAEEPVEQRGQRPAEPAGDRDAEPLLGPLEDRRREPTRRGPLEQPLGLAPAVFEGGGQRLDRVDQLGVQERGPDLQAAGHARPVDLGQDVLGQVGVLIQRQRARQRVGAGGEAAARAQVLGLDVDRVAGSTSRPRDLRPRERAEPALMRQRQRLGGAAEELLELEVEAEVAVIDRQPADRRARPAPGPAAAGGGRPAPPARPRTSDSRPAARRRRRRRGRP